MKFCIGHKSDDGVIWKKISAEKSRQVFIHGGESTIVITMVITGNIL